MASSNVNPKPIGDSSTSALAAMAATGAIATAASVKRNVSTSSKLGAAGTRTPTQPQHTGPSPQQRYALARLKARKEAAVFFKSVESWNNETMGSSLDDLSKAAKGIGGATTSASGTAAANNRQMKKAMSMIPGSNDEASQAMMLVWDTPMFHKFRLLSFLFTFFAFIFALCGLILNRFAELGDGCVFRLWDPSILGQDAQNMLDIWMNNSTLSVVGRTLQGDDHDDDYSGDGSNACAEIDPEFEDFFGWRLKVLIVYGAYLASTLIGCFAIIFSQCGRGGNLRKYVYRIHSTAELLVVNEFLVAGTTTYVAVKLNSEPTFNHFTMSMFMFFVGVGMQTLGTFFCSFDNLLVTCSEVCCPAYHRRTQKFVASQASTAAYRL